METRLNQFKEATFTIKRDFNLTGFLLRLKPDFMFTTTHVGGTDFKQINTNSSIVLNEAEICKLVHNNKTVIVLYEAQHKMDCYNFPDDKKLLYTVVEF